MRSDRVKVRAGEAVALLAMIREHSTGQPITSETGLAFVLRKDFGDYAVITPSAAPAITVYAPPAGTVGLPDPRWHPAVDGSDGFNVEVDLPAGAVAEIGQYAGSLSGQGIKYIWLIQVGSGS